MHDPASERHFWTVFRTSVLTFFVAGSVAAGIGFGIFITFLGEIPLVSDLRAYKPSLSTKIYDSKGALIMEMFSEQRTLINLDDTPKQLQQAVLAIEDNDFYHHFGIQFSGILRSALVNILHKSYAQGGSTITQQLAKNMFLTRRKTIERKIKEAILALQIERAYTKKEIFEMYMNQIYFGNGAYGVESASRSYFGKHVQDLTLAECALLAGLPRSPNNYNPYRFPKRAVGRRNLVLGKMRQLGYISPEAADAAKKEPLNIASIEVSEAPYFVEYVRKQLEDRYGSNAVYKGGLKVFTTLDLAMQHMAQDAFNEGMAEAEKLILPNLRVQPGRKPETLQGAMVALDPATGEIKAMIGGRNFAESKFNRAVQAQRQPGSSFKPFIYATAVMQGFTQADTILDSPVVSRDDRGNAWKPENFSNKFYGATTLRTAITHSRNVVTVKLLSKVGAQNVIDLAVKLGIKSTLKPYLTLALGACEMNLLELASAMGTFPNKGVHVEPLSILRGEDADGQVLEENTPARQEVMDEASAAIMVDMLESVLTHGTGIVARNLGFNYAAGGKTGTTNDYTDALFTGFTSEYVASVWIGLDSHRSLGRGITGGAVACPIWTKFMLKLYSQRGPRRFAFPGSVEFNKFCKHSGLLPNAGCETFVQTGAFAIGTSPSQHCDVHVGPGLAIPGSQLESSPDLVELDANTSTGKSRYRPIGPSTGSSARPPLF